MAPKRNTGSGPLPKLNNKSGRGSRPDTPISETPKEKDANRSQAQENSQKSDKITSNTCVENTDCRVGNDQDVPPGSEGGVSSGQGADKGSSSNSSPLKPTPGPSKEDDSTRASGLPSRSSTKDLAVLDDFLEVMKRTFSTMSVTFDALNQQTTRIAEMGPAIDAKYQVRIDNDLPSGH